MYLILKKKEEGIFVFKTLALLLDYLVMISYTVKIAFPLLQLWNYLGKKLAFNKLLVYLLYNLTSNLIKT